MKEKEAAETLRKICPTCGKPVAGARRLGSLTAFLFGASDCACSRGGDPAKAAHSSSTGQAGGEVDFCPKCGLQIITNARDGSLTGFLLQSTRCKCPPDKAFADGEMSAKFWRLKEAGRGTIFMSAATQPGRATTSSIDLAPGAIIGGVYKIIELIGRGGMGEVYLARHETLGKKCALKVIPPEQVTENGWQRFLLEAKAVAKLDHINLVRVTDLGIHEGCLPFYAMDYVDGRNLAELLSEHGPMPLKTVLELFIQVCDGVECAHRAGILHRDLKPANIMLVTGPTGINRAKVLDFGLAKLTKHDRSQQSLTAVGDVFGSPFYMSPEQCNGDRLDIRSDIYSLGCTMFECLTGRTPFSGQLASAVMFSHMEADPPSLESIVGPGAFPSAMEIVMAKLLRKNPVDRYQTLSQLRADLEQVAAGHDVHPVYVSRAKGSAPAKAPPHATPAPPARPLAIPLLVGSALALICLAVGTVSFVHPLQPVAKVPVVHSPEPEEDFFSTMHSNIAIPLSGLRKAGCTDQEIDQVKHYDTVEALQDFAEAENQAQKYLAQNIKVGSHFLNKGRTQINFPTNMTIGAISFGDSKPVFASGSIKVPAGENLNFYQNNSLKGSPSFLEMFGPEDLTGLELIQSHPDRAIEKIKNWRKLRKLSFFNSLMKAAPGMERYDSSPLTDQDLPALDRLKNLETLGLCGMELSGAKVADLSMLKKLKSLRLKQIQDIDAVLKILPELDNLREVWLIAQDTTDQQLEALVRMKNLESLRIRRSALTPLSLQFFRQMPALKHLYLDRNWSASEKAQFKAALRFAEFESVIDSTYWSAMTSP